jgi:hypothetical protein
MKNALVNIYLFVALAVKAIVTIAVSVFVVWLCGSFLEIGAKNTQENPSYSNYNAFILFENAINH